MTLEELLTKMKNIDNGWDRELSHKEADKILIEVIRTLSKDKIVENIIKEYENIPKWYA